MAFDLSSVTSGRSLGAPRILIHGTSGVGKTTWAAGAPSPIMVPLEEGIGTLEIPRFPLIKEWLDVMDVIGALHEEHDFLTVIFDSLDWLQPIIERETCSRNGWSSIEQPGYGKGPAAALGVWREFLAGVDSLRMNKGMSVVCICHSLVKRFDDPTSDPYDRYVLKLAPSASALMIEWSDATLYAAYKTYTAKSGTGEQKKVRGVGSGERVLHTTERPAFLAKNRYQLPDELPLDYAAFADAIS
jgi:AAA domain